jgi:hypothetical protein
LPATVSPAPVYRQMEKLEGIKREAEQKLGRLENGGAAVGMPAELKSYGIFRDALQSFLTSDPSDEMKSKIARYLIRWIKVHEAGFDINWAIGGDYVKCMLTSWKDAELGANIAALKTEKAGDSLSSPLTAQTPGVGSSNTLTNGRGRQI